MIYQKDNYNKKIAPFSYNNVTKQNLPVKVNISVAIRLDPKNEYDCFSPVSLLGLFFRDIISISEIEDTFTMKYAIHMEWYENRILYYNLKGKAAGLHKVLLGLIYIKTTATKK
jgi:hypothetical protein